MIYFIITISIYSLFNTLFLAFILPFYVGGYTTIYVGFAIYIFAFTSCLFVMISFKPPGFINPVPKNSEVFEDTLNGPASYLRDNLIRGYLIPRRFCDTCHFYRPVKASHCSVCNHCVERFDHHCIWINNCIGYNNYREFYLFINLIAIMLIHTCCTSIYTVVKSEYLRLKIIGGFIASGCLFFMIFVFTLCLFHCFLIFNALTTNEQVTRKIKSRKLNPFYLGIFNNCIRALLGPKFPNLYNYKKFKSMRELIYIHDQNRSAKIIPSSPQNTENVSSSDSNNSDDNGEFDNEIDMKTLLSQVTKHIVPSIDDKNLHTTHTNSCSQIIQDSKSDHNANEIILNVNQILELNEKRSELIKKKIRKIKKDDFYKNNFKHKFTTFFVKNHPQNIRANSENIPLLLEQDDQDLAIHINSDIDSPSIENNNSVNSTNSILNLSNSSNFSQLLNEYAQDDNDQDKEISNLIRDSSS